jgi:uncharacterized protein YjbI with pentapeptide repeats
MNDPVEWATPEGRRLASEILDRLGSGRPLVSLGLGEHEGRVDLRGYVLPAPFIDGGKEAADWAYSKLDGVIRFDGVRLSGLDFSGGKLQHARFFNSTITDCRFDNARCEDWRLWAVDTKATSFRSADLRGAVLGAWYNGRGDSYHGVDFSGANLGTIVCPAATFVDCDFAHARLVKVDFQSTSFIRCRFAGTIRDVIFQDRGFRTGKPDANPMEDVDFTQAELRRVEFRHLDLDKVTLPTSGDHLVLEHYRCALIGTIADIDRLPEMKSVRRVLEHELKWLGLNQRHGVLNRKDFAEMFGDGIAEQSLEMLSGADADCGRAALEQE